MGLLNHQTAVVKPGFWAKIWLPLRLVRLLVQLEALLTSLLHSHEAAKIGVCSFALLHLLDLECEPPITFLQLQYGTWISQKPWARNGQAHAWLGNRRAPLASKNP